MAARASTDTFLLFSLVTQVSQVISRRLLRLCGCFTRHGEVVVGVFNVVIVAAFPDTYQAVTTSQNFGHTFSCLQQQQKSQFECFPITENSISISYGSASDKCLLITIILLHFIQSWGGHLTLSSHTEFFFPPYSPPCVFSCKMSGGG